MSESRRILVADDERHIRRLIQVNLEKQGWSVVAVEDGRAAIEELERDPNFGIAVLDLMMSGVDGLGVLKWIRTHEQSKDIKVLIMSAQAEFMKHEPLEHQPDGWIEKPVDFDDFSDHFRK